jgi:TRAP-type C4-dicarboxylate transport system permease small subunit
MKKIARILDAFLYYILILGIGAMVFIVFGQIMFRILGITVPWTEEITRYIFIWITFLGMSSGFKDGEHTRLALFVNYFPGKIKKVGHYIQYVGNIIFLSIMSYVSFKFFLSTFQRGEMAYSIKMPMYIVSLSVPVSFIIALLGLIVRIIEIEFIVKRRN